MEEFRPLQIKHYLVFMVAEEKFAIDILDIDCIHTSRRKGAFDDMDDLKTAVRIYKRVVPIINLQKKLRLKGDAPVHPSLIFIKSKEDKVCPIVGLQVDQTLEIIETFVPKKPNGKSVRLIKAMIGLKNEVILVLRMKDLISADELVNAENTVLN